MKQIGLKTEEVQPVTKFKENMFGELARLSLKSVEILVARLYAGQPPPTVFMTSNLQETVIFKNLAPEKCDFHRNFANQDTLF